MNITSIQDFKPLTGGKVYALPFGNNVRGWDGIEVTEFIVVKVKRKYVELQQEGSRWVGDYDPRDLRPDYIFFSTLEDIIKYNIYKKMVDSLVQRCGGYTASSFFGKMSFEDLEAMLAILDKYVIK